MKLFDRVFHWVRWTAYRCLVMAERVVRRKVVCHAPKVQQRDGPNQDKPYIWLFVSTIGELNACESFIKSLTSSHNLVFLTDRFFYAPSYLDRYSNAIVLEVSDTANLSEVASDMPPRYIIVCEIPCLPNDAPCRFSYEALYNIKRVSRAPVYLINGWAYKYAPSCRQDRLENSLFESDYIGLFDRFFVQTKDVKSYLIVKGASASAIEVVGNMKFDSLSSTAPNLPCEVSQHLVRSYHNTEAPVIVAGCVTDIWEYKVVTAAMSHFALGCPDTRFVIAPRHPEKPEQIAALMTLIDQAGLEGKQKSKLSCDDQPPQVLVLDTIGELRAFYAASDICYVGVDHNVLEPLAFGRPVTVISGWNSTFPSYPVFEVLSSEELLLVCDSDNDLALQWQRHIGDSAEDVKQSIMKLSGASKKTLEGLKIQTA